MKGKGLLVSTLIIAVIAFSLTAGSADVPIGFEIEPLTGGMQELIDELSAKDIKFIFQPVLSKYYSEHGTLTIRPWRDSKVTLENGKPTEEYFRTLKLEKYLYMGHLTDEEIMAEIAKHPTKKFQEVITEYAITTFPETPIGTYFLEFRFAGDEFDFDQVNRLVFAAELLKHNLHQNNELEFSTNRFIWRRIGCSTDHWTWETVSYELFDDEIDALKRGFWVRWRFEKPGDGRIWVTGLANFMIVGYKE